MNPYENINNRINTGLESLYGNQGVPNAPLLNPQLGNIQPKPINWGGIGDYIGGVGRAIAGNPAPRPAAPATPAAAPVTTPAAQTESTPAASGPAIETSGGGMRYTPTTDANPVYGQSGDTVRALQTQLNSMGAGLNVDGLYGPLTQAAYNQYMGGAGAGQGTGAALVQETGYDPYQDTYDPQGIGFGYEETPEQAQERALRESIYNFNLDRFNQPINEEDIFNNRLMQYQAQIDATNAMFADELARARERGQGRIESRQFSQARSGQIGSGTGEAGVNRVQDANEDVYRSIERQRAAAIQGILGNVRSSVQADLAAKTQAKIEGADALLKELEEAPKRKKARISGTIAELIAQGIDINDMTPEELQSFVDGLQTSESQFKSEYEAQMAEAMTAAEEAELAAREAEADIAKTEAQTAKTTRETELLGQMTPYQAAQIGISEAKLAIAQQKLATEDADAADVTADLAELAQVVSQLKRGKQSDAVREAKKRFLIDFPEEGDLFDEFFAEELE